MTSTSEQRSTRKREVVIQESESSIDGESAAPVDRRKAVDVVRDTGGERRQRVIEDVGAKRQSYLRKAAQVVSLVAVVLELLLGLRFVLKLIAANPNSPFARFIYDFTNLFLWPFRNLTVTPAADNGMVLELSTLIAMAVYAIGTWILIKVLYLIFTPS